MGLASLARPFHSSRPARRVSIGRILDSSKLGRCAYSADLEINISLTIAKIVK